MPWYTHTTTPWAGDRARETVSSKRKKTAKSWRSPSQLAAYQEAKTSFCLMFPLLGPIHRKLWSKTVLPCISCLWQVFSHSFVKSWLIRYTLHRHWRPLEGKLLPSGRNNGICLLCWRDTPLCPWRVNCLPRSITWVVTWGRTTPQEDWVILKKWEG